MFGSLLETEDEGEYACDTSGQDFANFDVKTEMENTNQGPEEPRRIFFCRLYSLLQNFLVSVYFVRCAVFQNTCPLNGSGKNTDPPTPWTTPMDYPKMDDLWKIPLLKELLFMYFDCTYLVSFRSQGLYVPF